MPTIFYSSDTSFLDEDGRIVGRMIPRASRVDGAIVELIVTEVVPSLFSLDDLGNNMISAFRKSYSINDKQIHAEYIAILGISQPMPSVGSGPARCEYLFYSRSLR